MKNVGIIGLGVVSKYLVFGLTNSKKWRLVSIADIDTNKKEKTEQLNCKFYNNYLEMLAKESLDYVVISTPPESHYKIIKDALNAGKNVLVEKPVVLDTLQYQEIFNIAKQKKLVLRGIYHWQNSLEIKHFIKNYNPKKITSIKLDIKDPYSQDGKTVLPDRVALKGAWIDSGVNVLSMLKLLLPFDSYKIENTQFIFCKKSGIPIFAKVNLKIDQVNVEITVDWRTMINNKVTTIKYDGYDIVLDHTNQKVISKGKTKELYKMARMNTHYYNYFTYFKGVTDTPNYSKIYEILLKVRECYEKA